MYVAVELIPIGKKHTTSGYVRAHKVLQSQNLPRPLEGFPIWQFFLDIGVVGRENLDK